MSNEHANVSLGRRYLHSKENFKWENIHIQRRVLNWEKNFGRNLPRLRTPNKKRYL